MKRLVRSATRTAFGRLPVWMQEEFLAAYKRRYGAARLLSAVAAELGVSVLKVRGELGEFQGVPRDEAVLLRYGRTGKYASGAVDVLRAFFEAAGGGTYLDIGANIGLTTVPVAENPRVSCVCFEPSPENFEHLCENVRVRCTHENVALHKLALLDRSEQVPFELSPTNPGDHRVRLASHVGLLGEDEWPTIDVPAARLDDVVLPGEGPLAIKMDVQGAEPLVIKGGARTFARADLVVLEFAPYWMARMGTEPEVVYRLLESLATVSLLPEGSVGEAEAVSPEQAVARLREFANEHLQDHTRYLDVAGWRVRAS